MQIMAELRHGQVPLQLRCAIVTCRLLFDCTFEEIERKTGVQTDTAAKIMRRAIFRAGNEDFQDVLACVGDANRHGAPPRVSEGSQMSADVRNAMLKHNTEKPVDAVEKENLFTKVGQKRPARSTLERIQHDHIHKAPDGSFVEELIRATVPLKPHLAPGDEPKRKNWCDWAVEEIDKGAIFICSDESIHEIKGGSVKRQKMTRPKGVPSEEYAVADPTVKFTQMHWGCHSTEPVPMIGPQYLWEPLTPEQKPDKDVECAARNLLARESVEEKRRLGEISGTKEYEELQVY